MRFVFITFVAVAFFRCTDNCEQIVSYYNSIPVYATTDSIRGAVEIQDPRAIDSPTRLYFKDDFIFIVEDGSGIHIVDNQDPTNPIGVKFIQIPGSQDLAIMNNYLYADSYIDLLVFDVSDINNISLTNRIESVFEYYHGYYAVAEANLVLIDFREELVEDVYDVDCSAQNDGGVVWLETANFADASRAEGVGGSGSGTGGSMARFTITNGLLYTVDLYSVRNFDIADPSAPDPGEPVQLGWDIETVFPYENSLFMGGRSGMYIVDISTPETPELISVFQHANACDPVVVEDDIAYVTLRDGNECETFTNQLEIVDVSDLTNPRLLKTYPMYNPHGLGIRNGCLYICDGDEGLKYYNATDPLDIQLLKHHDDIHALDVIPLPSGRLLMIGNDGFYQYEGLCQDDIQYLSTLSF